MVCDWREAKDELLSYGGLALNSQCVYSAAALDRVISMYKNTVRFLIILLHTRGTNARELRVVGVIAD